MTDTLRAIGLMTLAMAAFALADMTIKILSQTLPTAQILTLLGAGGGLLFAVILRARGLPLWTGLAWHPGVLARNAADIAGTTGIITALSLIPFSQVSAIMQAAPLVVTLGAAVFLGEQVGPRRWSVILVGLLGVLIILAPEPGNPLTLGTLAAVIGMIGLSSRDLATRFTPATAPTAELAFLSLGATMLAGGLLALVQGGAWPTPSRQDAGLLVLMVGAAGIAYFCVTAAMRLGDVAAVAPFRYTRIVFAFGLAVLVLGETLTPRTLTGTALIVAAGLYTLLREHKLAQTRALAARKT